MSVAEGALSEEGPVSWDAGTPCGAGRAAASAQLVPFQWDATGVNTCLLVCWVPTAVASVGEKLATPVKENPELTVTCCQLVPFQCSARPAFAPVLLSYTDPTAQPSVAESMLRDLRSGCRFVPDGLGLGTCAQVVPSQCTISVPPESPPAAQTLDGERASTADRPTPAGRPGIVTGAQLVPFQCSRSALVRLSALSPTAQASEADSTLTAVRSNL